MVAGRRVKAETRGADLILSGVDADFFESVLAHYFDLETDYRKVLAGFKEDAILDASMAFAPGIRVLNQEPFETLISFIISANNNVKRIMSIVQRLSERYGEAFISGGEICYAFPTPRALANAHEADLRACGTGYRARYIIGSARAVAEGFDLNAQRERPYLEARKALTTLPGVGNKVADCVLLYALGFKNAFPMDVWVKRIVHELYGFGSKKDTDVLKFVAEKFGENAGIAQQYLFYYAKANKMR